MLSQIMFQWIMNIQKTDQIFLLKSKYLKTFSVFVLFHEFSWSAQEDHLHEYMYIYVYIL